MNAEQGIDVTQAREAVSGRGVLIAIDGPSGSGKSTVSKQVAKDLGIAFLDTGAMYRALTWYALENGVDVESVEALLVAADEMDFHFEGTVDDPHFFVRGQDVTLALRSEPVVKAVSTVAGHIPVRNWMAKEQRKQMLRSRGNGRGMVAEGRDITTVVCPDADVRVLLVADADARIRRRTLEVYGQVNEELLAKTADLVSGRDQIDSKVSTFMEAAEGVTTVDSSDMTIREVVDTVIQMAVDACAEE